MSFIYGITHSWRDRITNMVPLSCYNSLQKRSDRYFRTDETIALRPGTIHDVIPIRGFDRFRRSGKGGFQGKGQLMRLLTVIATVCVVGAVSQNDGAAQEPKKKSSPVVRVLKGWSLDKLGGDEEMVAWDYRYRAFYGPDADLGWPGVGAVYKSLDPIATLYRDKDFLRKLDKEVDFSKNVLLRYAWRGGGPPVSYHFSGTKEGPVVLFSRRLLRTRDQIPGSTELIIPADVYKRSVKLGLQDR